MNPSPVVVCVGLLTLDVTHVVQRLPTADEKVLGLGQTLAVGGPATNAAATAAALGARAHLIAPYGRSAVSGIVARLLSAAGVTWHDAAPGVTNHAPLSTVLVDAATGHRAVVSGGAPRLPDDAGQLEGLLVRLVEGADAVLVDGHAVAFGLAAAREASRHGIPVLFDGGSHKPGTDELLPLVDLAILSADFRAPGGGDPLHWVLERGARYAAQSRGAGPVRFVVGEVEHEVAVPPVTVVDTVGAGDVLHGAAAYEAARNGLSDSTIRMILESAVRVASRSCAHPGALGWAREGQ
jgi:sugar/nucleoside kinase (ribokinase family)